MTETKELDLNELEIVSEDGDLVFARFLKEYNLEKKRLLFVTSDLREGLMKNTEKYKDTVDIVQQEFVDVNDLLKAQKIYIELESLEFLAVTHSPQ